MSFFPNPIGAGSRYFEGPLQLVTSTTAITGLALIANGLAANNKAWALRLGSGGDFGIYTGTDAGAASSVAIDFTRTNLAVATVTFGNGTDNPTFTFNGTGLTQVGGGLRATGTRPTVSTSPSQLLLGADTAGTPQLWWVNSTGGSNAKIWDCFASATDLQFRLVNDANSAATTWLDVTRSGTSVTTVAFAGPVNIGSPSSATTACVITQSNSGQAALDLSYTNTAVGSSQFRFLNTSASAQSELDFFANGTNTGRIRNDFQGSLSYVAFTGTGTHVFWVRGDSGVGAQSLSIASTGAVSIAAPSSGFAFVANGDCALGLSGNTVRVNVPTQTTATAGGASALPALPVGYMSLNVAGNFRAIPFYNL